MPLHSVFLRFYQFQIFCSTFVQLLSGIWSAHAVSLMFLPLYNFYIKKVERAVLKPSKEKVSKPLKKKVSKPPKNKVLKPQKIKVSKP